MPTLRLTDKALKRKAPATGTLELWDTVTPGLALRIHAGGRRSYCVTTRLVTGDKPRQIRRTIGTVASHKLAEAREEARKVIADAARGIDSASKEAKRAAAKAAQIEAERSKANSFRSCVEAYLSDPGKYGGLNNRKTGKPKKSHKLEKQRLENHALPRFGDRPIGEITRSDVKDLLRGMVQAGDPTAANRLLGNLKLVFKWAVENDKIDSSPIADMDRPAAESSRERVLEDWELAEVWRGCGTLSKAHGGAIRLMMLTGARRSEAAGLLRSEIRGDEWHLPAERSKNGRPHIWPLPDLALKIIDSVPQIEDGDPVFTLTGDRPINGWSKVKARLDRQIGEARAKAARKKYEPEKHNLPHWTLHDLRRSLVTGMVERLGIAPHVVEAVVNHVSGDSRAGVAGVYNRSVLLPQRREALAAWARHIASVVSGASPTSNVADLSERRAS